MPRISSIRRIFPHADSCHKRDRVEAQAVVTRKPTGVAVAGGGSQLHSGIPRLPQRSPPAVPTLNPAAGLHAGGPHAAEEELARIQRWPRAGRGPGRRAHDSGGVG